MRSLEHGVHEAGATRRTAFDGGVAYFNDEAPLIWDANFVRFDGPAQDPAATVERFQAGQGHRAALVEDAALADALAPDLIAAGMRRRDLLAMAREPGEQLDPDVRDVPFGELGDFLLAINMEWVTVDTDEVARQLAQLHGRRERHWFVIFAGDEPVGHLVVYSEAGLAQIESVAVRKRFHGRGLATRLIRHALAALGADHDTVFIVAEADDWPKDFYARLGFRPVERRSDFLLIKAG